MDRFWSKVNKDGPLPPIAGWTLGCCWLWTAGLDGHGYGHFDNKGAHRVAFYLTHGYWPPNDLDHLCRVLACVNPAHVEPVTRRVNLLRGNTITARNAAVTHCPAGHEYTLENTRLQVRRGTVGRKCRICHRLSQRARYRRQNGVQPQSYRPDRWKEA